MTDEELERLEASARMVVERGGSGFADGLARDMAITVLTLLECVRKAEAERDELDSARALMAERARRAEEAAQWNEARAKERNDFADRLNKALERAKEAEARVAELMEVAREVESLTEDVAKNANCSDCPYVSQERAKELLAIIRKP